MCKKFIKKEIIFQTVNSCIHFISELGVKKTEFSTSLDKLRGELSKNIPVEKIREYGESLKHRKSGAGMRR